METSGIDSHVFMEEAVENFHWKLHEAAKLEELHEVTFAIRQNNVDKLESTLYDVSSPSSINYGKHWTREELAAFTANPIGATAVKEFLTKGGAIITFESKHGEYITAQASVRFWENMFNTKFFRFARSFSTIKDVQTSKKAAAMSVLRAKKYSLPRHLMEHVATVFDLVHLPVPSRIKARLHDLSNYDGFPKKKQFIRTQGGPGFVSPPLINSQYGIPSNVGLSTASQGVYAALGQYLSPSDLTAFQQYFNLPQRGISYSYGDHVADGQCGSNSEDCMEANLDVQYIMAVAQYVSTTFYYWDDSQDFMVGWMKSVSSIDNLAQIYSISYGADETAVSSSYASQFNVEAAKLGILGVTIIVASGDDGAVTSRASGNSNKCGYAPSFPATSPYVTAVGATMGPEDGNAEVACQAGGQVAITTGGGFSVRYSRPSYQDNAIRGYFATVSGTSLAPASGYNANGRGLPDVSLLGHNYVIVVDQQSLYVDGTSASAPAFAGMVALLNSYRLANQSSPMGWLNPALYDTNGTFANDITSGDNKCTSIYGGSYGSYLTTCCTQGYTATPGWDPVTGFGSIDFHEFIQEYAELSPYNIVAPSASSNQGGIFSQWSTKVVIGFVAALIVVAGVIFYLVGLLINRCCSRKSNARYRYQESNATGANHAPVSITAMPPSSSVVSSSYSGVYTQPPQQRQNLQIDRGGYFADSRPAVVTVRTRL